MRKYATPYTLQLGYKSSLEVLVEGETGVGLLLFLILLGAGHDTSLLVVANTLLEEVGLASERDRLHEVEGVGGVVVLLVTESNQETVSHELDVLTHQLGVHAKESNRKSISQELLFDADGFNDDVLDDLLAGAVVEMREQKASEVSVETLVTRDQFVGEGETRHHATLLQPEDRSERSREENTLNSSEGHQTLGEGRLLILDPFDGPVGLLANARDFKSQSLSIKRAQMTY